MILLLYLASIFMENLPLANDFTILIINYLNYHKLEYYGRSILMENQPLANDFITLIGIYIYGKSATR